MGIEILQGATLRETDGLAMSSRNAYLDDNQRKTAVNLNKIMRELCDDYNTAPALNPPSISRSGGHHKASRSRVH